MRSTQAEAQTLVCANEGVLRDALADLELLRRDRDP